MRLISQITGGIFGGVTAVVVMFFSSLTVFTALELLLNLALLTAPVAAPWIFLGYLLGVYLTFSALSKPMFDLAVALGTFVFDVVSNVVDLAIELALTAATLVFTAGVLLGAAIVAVPYLALVAAPLALSAVIDLSQWLLEKASAGFKALMTPKPTVVAPVEQIAVAEIYQDSSTEWNEEKVVQYNNCYGTDEEAFQAAIRMSQLAIKPGSLSTENTVRSGLYPSFRM